MDWNKPDDDREEEEYVAGLKKRIATLEAALREISTNAENLGPELIEEIARKALGDSK